MLLGYMDHDVHIFQLLLLLCALVMEIANLRNQLKTIVQFVFISCQRKECGASYSCSSENIFESRKL